MVFINDGDPLLKPHSNCLFKTISGWVCPLFPEAYALARPAIIPSNAMSQEVTNRYQQHHKVLCEHLRESQTIIKLYIVECRGSMTDRMPLSCIFVRFASLLNFFGGKMC